MRVRPFFWFLLALSCAGVLLFAAITPTHAPAIMQVRLDEQHPSSTGLTTLELQLTDPQGLPLEKAQVFSSASMTNMVMVTEQIGIRDLGQGKYVAQLHLYMAGPWTITVKALADGFDSVQQTLLVHVV